MGRDSRGSAILEWIWISSVQFVIGGLQDEPAPLSQVSGDLVLPAVSTGPVMPEYALIGHVCRGVVSPVLFLKLGRRIATSVESWPHGAVGFVPDAARVVVTPLRHREAPNAQEQDRM